MKLTNKLERVWITIQIMLYASAGLVPIIGGIGLLYESQTSFFEKDYQQEMYLGLGIICIIVGLLICWASFVRIIQLIRYNNTLK